MSTALRGQEQTFSKNSIKLGFGVGASMGDNTEGFGFVYAVGYQREIWKDRLRVNPNFSIGHYSPIGIADVPDLYFNSINLETNLYYDLIRIKSFSFVLGTGGLVNNSRGLRGTGGKPDPSRPKTSKYINDFHFAGCLSVGFRLNFPNTRTVINMVPLSIHFGNNYFGEIHSKIEFDFKF